MLPTQDSTTFNHLLGDSAVVGQCPALYLSNPTPEDIPPFVAPVLLDVRFQPPQTFFMEPLSGTLPTQAHYDAPPWIPKIPNLQFHNSPDSWMDLPQAVTVPFENSISATQWDDVSGMSSSVIDLAQPHMELPAIPQPPPPPPPAQTFAPSCDDALQRPYDRGRSFVDLDQITRSAGTGFTIIEDITAPTQGSTGWNNLLHGETAVADWCTTLYLPDSTPEDIPPLMAPALVDVQFEPPQSFFTEPLSGTLSTQAPYDVAQWVPKIPNLQLHNSPGSWMDLPQTVTAPFENSISAVQWNHASGTSSSVIDLAHPQMEPPAIPQPPLSPPPAQTFVPSWDKVPQIPYGHGRSQWDFKPFKSISFSINGLPGINMKDALRKKFTGLDDRDDAMFKKTSGAISCRLLFLGYPPNRSAQISTLGWTKDRARITRSKLAYEVAKKVDQHLESMAGYPMKKSADQRWKIGEGRMRLENMYLVRLVSVSKGSFQPEIWVVDS